MDRYPVRVLLTEGSSLTSREVLTCLLGPLAYHLEVLDPDRGAWRGSTGGRAGFIIARGLARIRSDISRRSWRRFGAHCHDWYGRPVLRELSVIAAGRPRIGGVV